MSVTAATVAHSSPPSLPRVGPTFAENLRSLAKRDRNEFVREMARNALEAAEL
jgi:hypothetical protein